MDIKYELNNADAFLNSIPELQTKPIANYEMNKSLSILSEEELSKYETPTTSFIIERLIPSGVTLLAGKGDSYKTLLAMWLAESIVNGIKLFDMFEVSPSAVLFMALEGDYSLCKQRNSLIRKGLELDKFSDVYFFSEQEFSFSESEITKLIQLIENKKIGLIIIDALVRAGASEENSASEMAKFFRVIKKICNETGVSFLILHHEKKGTGGDRKEQIRGSSDIINFMDSILQVERKGNRITLTHSKSRRCNPIDPLALEINWTEDSISINCTGTAQFKTKSQDCASKIIVWYTENKLNFFRTSDVVDYCENIGFKERMTKDCLDLLKQRGVIDNKQRGKWEVIGYGNAKMEGYE